MKEDTNKSKLKKEFEKVYRLAILTIVIVAIFGLIMGYLIINPQFFDFKKNDSTTELPEIAIEEDFDKIENGIHVSTGFVDAPGMKETIQNCTNCHSSKLVLQNRMTAERWKATIRWMQETQNLWDLGANEDIIIDYLTTNYPPKEKGRRAALTDIDWYELK
ncbi:MAG: monoheme cytochrome C [Pseudozobellia sp.]|nr:monoheme cytochrome C [Pseudozobellia sp.]MBG49361.1 monoheme cytochrome C [Pseudozobellia sp.]|tara:strand:- start:288 stop:773 length:486 start_codon:yes stop_codon:yes gene_type:complete